MDRNNAPMISPPTRRPPPSAVCSLGPVPPTPADWVDEPVQPAQPVLGRSPGLTIDTAAAAAAAAATSNTANVPDPLPSSGSASGRLSRAGAVRHDKTIIQRRTESRCRHTPEGSIDTVPRPRQVADIVVLNSPHTNPATTTKKPTPRSGGGTLHEAHPVSDSLPQGDSRNSTPRASGSTNCYQVETASPPFPSHLAKVGQSSAKTVQHMMPKALPTPPPRPRSESSSRRNNSFRPPLPDTPPVFRRLAVSQSADQFEAATLERVQTFTAMEAAASTDADRVRLFADFIVNESRIRRERYSSAIGEMGSEILDLTRDLFRPVEGSRRESATSQEEWTPASTDPTTSRRDSAGSVMRTDELSHSAPTSSKAPASSKIPTSPSGGPSITANWSTNYMPSLSPILSMSVSDRHENGSSRGRPPSRWWELDSLGDGPRVLGRSKRESKYMGVPKDQWVEEEPIRGEASDNGSTSAYPPEKTGWLDQGEASSKPQGFPLSDAPSSSSVLEPLDVSRLITMPPPYPRHHPAENNNHPELTTIRCSVRMLGDLTQANKSNESFANASAERREKFSKAASERRQHLRANLQKEIGAGNLNYSDAAVIESDSEQQERDRKKELEKTEYERFQNEVVIPLNDLLTRRITLATSLFDDLSHHLFDNGEIDADMPQEEGDDRPELLEKLTLLKWIFETRETLHRTIYDILSDRNSRYCDVVVTPYRLSSNAEKLKSAEAFFAEDAARREQAFAMEILGRATLFRSVMEEAVERGVAMQLSAFWDIAPPLRDLLDSIPSDFDNFGVQIPPSEYEENPSYQHHPLQYLYGLLQHMEKSTYRFIESHTNLLCLLHEVKEATVNAEARVLATKREDSDGTILDDEYCEERVRMMRQSETKRLTADLKEKVRAVQDQWNSALANRIRTSKELTRAWLLQTGGWDESLEESEGFGGE
ncbi:hypothetical protein DCS_07039 [Drechmeria coniospora]|uniref:Uncharacterized protein n=1 Tax=Drechmeria coniospora TaxID=98403 RepID=A0A151GDA6_DRECN|nr:hypothetical protein DCS_07039 [Drechmeria coniospora]KYK55078.1 hypothetical protein DCS_07039 [Drechmeria coniospora]